MKTIAVPTTPATSTDISAYDMRGIVKASAQVRLLAGGAALVALAGCASPPYQGKYAWSEGWRKAEVVAVQTVADMERPRFYTCVRSMSAEQLATTKFALVKYQEMSRTQRHAVPLSIGDALAPGDGVYIQANDCHTPVVRQSAGTRAD